MVEFTPWRHRWLLLAFIGREIKNRYVGSSGGLFWAVIHPVILLAIYALVFRSVFRVTFPELGEHSFAEFVAVALWPWLAFQEGLQRGLQAVQANASLVKKVAFPHELLVYGAVAATFLVHSVGYVVVLLILAIFGNGIHAAGLPVAAGLMVLLFLLSTALALVLAAAQVFLRDVDQFMGPVLMVLFYATPLLYPFTMVPEWLRTLMSFNPLLYFVQPLREALLEGRLAIGWPELLTWALVPVAAVLALRFFRKLSPHFEDLL